MEAEELRIGNWLTVPRKKDNEYYDKPVRVGAIGKGTFGVIEDGKRLVAIKDDLSPIPLTEEILLKAGFEHYLDYSYELNFLDESNTAIHVDFDEDDLTKVARVCIGQEDHRIEKRDRAREWVYFKNIDYVHSLQNLYFALTGEELNIEL
jgi:hypothetical protein